MSRSVTRGILKAVAWSLAALALLLVLAVGALFLIDANAYRSQIESLAGTALGRKITVEGDMRFVPSLLPRLAAEGVRIANPGWASRPDFATAKHFEIVLAVLPLVRDEVVIHELELEGADVLLEEGPEGANNWTFGTPADAGRPRTGALPSLEAVVVSDSILGYRETKGAVHRLEVGEASASMAANEPVALTLQGTYRGTPFRARLSGGTLTDLLAPADSWAIAGNVSSAGASLTLDGHLIRPTELGGLALKVELNGQRLGELNPAIGMQLPPLGPYRLQGQLSVTRDSYGIDRLVARLGNSQLSGNLLWSASPAGSRISGDLASDRLDLDEILAALESPGTPPAARPEDSQGAIAGRELGRVDADLRLAVTELVYAPIPLEDLALHATTEQTTEEPGPPQDRLRLEASGVWRDLSIQASLDGGILSQLLAPTEPWPVKASAQAAGASLDIDGSIAEPAAFEGLDLKLALRGARLEELSRAFGADLAAVGAFEASSRLTASEGTYRFGTLTARAGGSDLAGQLTLSISGSRPALSGELSSRQLDLLALVPKEARAGPRDPAQPRYPDNPLPAPDLTGFDADLTLNATRLRGLDEILDLPYSGEKVSLKVKVAAGKLRLEVLRAQLLGGVVAGTLDYEPSAPKPALTLATRTEQLDIEQALALLKEPLPLTGRADDVHLHLRGAGRTWRELWTGAALGVKAARTDLRYLAPGEAEPPVRVSLSASELKVPKGGDVELSSQAVYRETPLSIGLQGGTLADLLWDPSPWPIRLQADGSGASLLADGAVDLSGEALKWQLQVRLDGQRLSDLSHLARASLPEAGPYHLEGQLREHEGGFRLSAARARVGETSAEGGLTYRHVKPRPRVTADLTVDPLQIRDFYKPPPRAVASKAAVPRKKDSSVLEEYEEPVAPEAAPGKGGLVIPDFQIRAEELLRADGEISLTVKRILAGKEPLGTASVQATLEDGRLVASPITAGDESASYLASLELQDSDGVAALEHWARFHDDNLGRLLKGLGISQDLVADISVDAALSTRGPDFRDLLAQGNGHISIVAGKGKLPARLLQLWAGGLINVLFPTHLLGKDQTALNCVVARFKIKDATLSSDAILIDTTDFSIGGHGAIDLRTEAIRFVFQPGRKKADLVNLGTPVTVTGTLAHPVIKLAPSGGLLTLGKLVLGFVNPTYLVVLTADTGTGEKNPCLTAVARRDAGEVIDQPRGILGRIEGLFRKAPSKAFE
jgi:uncharacterized protein involved in outer membrane biogenesis